MELSPFCFLVMAQLCMDFQTLSKDITINEKLLKSYKQKNYIVSKFVIDEIVKFKLN